MVPRVSSNGPGRSFFHAGLYYLHDKREPGEEYAYTDERVEFSHTRNLTTNDPDQALYAMYRTAEREKELKRSAGLWTGGEKCRRPVITFSLSWALSEDPTREHMIETGRAYQAHLGLAEHQALYVAHNDEDYKHLHIILNRVHPQTGMVAALKRTKLKSSEFALAYEEKHGIHCHQRVENWEKRRQGQFTTYREQQLSDRERITELYRQSDSGKAWVAALRAEGYELAEGRKIMIVTPDGKQHDLSRQVDGARARDIRAKLAGVILRDIKAVRAEILARHEQQKQQDMAAEKRRAQQERTASQTEQETRAGGKDRQEEMRAPGNSPAPPKVQEQFRKEATRPAAKQQQQPEYWDRDEAECRRQDELENTAIEAEKKRIDKEREGRQAAWKAREEWKKAQQAQKDAGTWKSNEQLNREQAQRIARQAKFSDAMLEGKRQTENYIREHFGEQEKEWRGQLKDLETALEKRGKAARLRDALTGKEKEDRAQMEALQKNLAHMEQRKAEIWGAYEKDRQRREEQFRRELEKDYGPAPTVQQPEKGPRQSPAPAQEFSAAAKAPELSQSRRERPARTTNDNHPAAPSSERAERRPSRDRSR